MTFSGWEKFEFPPIRSTSQNHTYSPEFIDRHKRFSEASNCRRLFLRCLGFAVSFLSILSLRLSQVTLKEQERNTHLLTTVTELRKWPILARNLRQAENHPNQLESARPLRSIPMQSFRCPRNPGRLLRSPRRLVHGAPPQVLRPRLASLAWL